MSANAAAAESKWADFERAVTEMCVQLPVSSGAAGLARELARLSPQYAFREVLVRGGWYRPGGVVTAGGARIADALVGWAEKELASRGDDLQALADEYAGSGLKATRLTGKTHYLVADAGSGAADFIQVEIEELQEIVSHELFGGDAPLSLDELIDPPAGKSEAKPIGAPFFSLRRITDVGGFLARMRVQKPEPQPIHRFFEAWQGSSAGSATQLSNHWVIAVREHLDRYRQPILQATPVAAVNGLPPKFESAYGARGLALQKALQGFDRRAGYPMAWFFHMLTTKAVPHAVATAVIEDVQSGFRYLPDRDTQAVRDWLHRPFGF